MCVCVCVCVCVLSDSEEEGGVTAGAEMRLFSGSNGHILQSLFLFILLCILHPFFKKIKIKIKGYLSSFFFLNI